jgi:hypothetical protein
MTNHNESLRNETPVSCAAPDCTNPVTHHPTGRPARYCSTTCRVRHHRQRKTSDPITIEIDTGSASSRGRTPERSWLVRIRRGDNSVIIAIGLRHHAATRLAEQLTNLLTTTTTEAHPHTSPTDPHGDPWQTTPDHPQQQPTTTHRADPQ